MSISHYKKKKKKKTTKRVIIYKKGRDIMNENNQFEPQVQPTTPVPIQTQDTTVTSTPPTIPTSFDPMQNMQSTDEPQKVVEEPKKNNTLGILVFIIGLGLILFGAFGTNLLLKTETTPVDNEKTDTSNKPLLFQVTVNGSTINFPCTKEAFDDTGWSWDEKYAKADIEGGYTTSGGRIGEYPGGVVVSVINKTQETKHIEDCTIDDGTFYNPEDDSNQITFIGGLTFSSTVEEVKEKMEELGYKNPKESPSEDAIYLRYFLEDNPDDYKNYIEFYFNNNIIKSVDIKTAG